MIRHEHITDKVDRLVKILRLSRDTFKGATFKGNTDGKLRSVGGFGECFLEIFEEYSVVLGIFKDDSFFNPSVVDVVKCVFHVDFNDMFSGHTLSIPLKVPPYKGVI